MKKYNRFTSSLFLSFFSILITIACSEKPKVITANKPDTQDSKSPIVFYDQEKESDPQVKTPHSSQNGTSKVHTVVVEEVLPTSKYVYLLVKEGEEEFWIATSKMDVSVGETVFYERGILKTNFESKEYNRIFKKLYLVSSVIKTKLNLPDSFSNLGTESSESTESTPIIREGSIKIVDLVKNIKDYEGKTVQLSGKCSKLNTNIMGRNWIHLKDGSMDDYDLVITSDMAIPKGHVVTMQAKVTLKKDFGSGYFYDIILEDGTLVK